MLFQLVPSVIRIDIPALDRLVEFLSSSQQKEIDALVARLKVSSNKLKEITAHAD